MSPLPAGDRLSRLLAIVPWVAAQDGPEIAEVCARFEVSESELLADLDLLFMCGVYPFTPDALIEVDVDDGRVWIRFADYFRRPLRLTPPEGLGLLMAGSAVLATPGADRDGPLASALAKLGRALGVERPDVVEVELGNADPEVLARLRSAVEEQRKVRIHYYTFGRDRWTDRVIHPARVFVAAGQWYVSGYCELAAAERLFRLERIANLELLEERFEQAQGPQGPDAGEEAGGPELFHPSPDAPQVILELDPRARWIAESYPTEQVEPLEDGRLRVTLRSEPNAWLERVLLRAGPDATVISGAAGVAAGAARRILERYQPS